MVMMCTTPLEIDQTRNNILLKIIIFVYTITNDKKTDGRGKLLRCL